jgi:hypothetical protein
VAETSTVNHRSALFGLAFGLACQTAPAPQPASTLAPTPGPSVAAPGPNTAPSVAAAAASPNGMGTDDDAQRVAVRADGQLGPGKNTLFIDISPPEGAKLTLESPLSVRGSGGIGLSFPRRLSGPLSDHPMPLRLQIDVSDGATGPAQLEVTYYYCTDGNEAACRREQARLNVELDLTGASAGGEAHLSYHPKGDRS